MNKTGGVRSGLKLNPDSFKHPLHKLIAYLKFKMFKHRSSVFIVKVWANKIEIVYFYQA